MSNHFLNSVFLILLSACVSFAQNIGIGGRWQVGCAAWSDATNASLIGCGVPLVITSAAANGSAVTLFANSGGVNQVFSSTTGTGTLLPLAFGTNAEALRINTDRSVRITSNTSTPAPPTNNVLQVARPGTGNSELVMDAFAGVPLIDFRRANTSAAAPTQVLTSDALGALSAIGYGTSGYSTARAQISFLANQNWTDVAQGAYIIISTTSNGTTSLLNRLTIVDGVFLGTGSDPGQGGLNVTGALVLTGLASASTGDYLCFNTGNSKVSQGTAPCTSSSERSKHDIHYDNIPGLELVRQMQPIRFIRNDHPELGEQYGFRAEDVFKIDSRLVNVDQEGRPEGVLYMNYTAVLTKALQELWHEHIELVNILSHMDYRLNRLETK